MIIDILKILIVEDNISDFMLIEHQINKVLEKPYISHVSSLEKFKASLVNFKPDIIISDYKLSGFTGMDVLEFAQKSTPSTCFIFVTGTINNEEVAANTILNGASGYILKKNMSKLSEKLLPIFEKIIENKKTLLSPQYQETVEAIKGFIDSASKSNDIHIKNYESMKKSLEKFKKEIR